MIGLGSNRLTVCRRGGMSVTQAGKGGMEWLAGNGLRERTPYSVQATVALKAQFPTQWPTIRDYGFAHPEIVGYMNAYAPEDAKIAYSLVEGIGTRWLDITGSASLLTGITLAGNSEIRWKWKYDDNGIVQIGHRAGGSGSNGVVIDTGTVVSNNVRTYMIPGGSQWATAFSGLSKGVAYEMRYDITNGKLYKDNSSSNLSANATALTVGQLSIESATNGSVSYIEGDNNRIYPYIKNGICGMLDIETGTFHQQTAGSGSFTISETPAS